MEAIIRTGTAVLPAGVARSIKEAAMRGKNDSAGENSGRLSDDWLETLEKVKQEYQQYVEVSELYKFPRAGKVKVIHHQPPSLEHPLTINIF